MCTGSDWQASPILFSIMKLIIYPFGWCFTDEHVTCTVVQAAQMSGNIGLEVSARKLPSQFLYVVFQR
jgi:hypothetical protein